MHIINSRPGQKPPPKKAVSLKKAAPATAKAHPSTTGDCGCGKKP